MGSTLEVQHGTFPAEYGLISGFQAVDVSPVLRAESYGKPIQLYVVGTNIPNRGRGTVYFTVQGPETFHQSSNIHPLVTLDGSSDLEGMHVNVNGLRSQDGKDLILAANYSLGREGVDFGFSLDIDGETVNMDIEEGKVRATRGDSRVGGEVEERDQVEILGHNEAGIFAFVANDEIRIRLSESDTLVLGRNKKGYSLRMLKSKMKGTSRGREFDTLFQLSVRTITEEQLLAWQEVLHEEWEEAEPVLRAVKALDIGFAAQGIKLTPAKRIS